MTSRVQEQKGLNAAQARAAVDDHFSDIAKLHGIEKMPKNTGAATTTTTTAQSQPRTITNSGANTQKAGAQKAKNTQHKNGSKSKGKKKK